MEPAAIASDGASVKALGAIPYEFGLLPGAEAVGTVPAISDEGAPRDWRTDAAALLEDPVPDGTGLRQLRLALVSDEAEWFARGWKRTCSLSAGAQRHRSMTGSRPWRSQLASAWSHSDQSYSPGRGSTRRHGIPYRHHRTPRAATSARSASWRSRCPLAASSSTRTSTPSWSTSGSDASSPHATAKSGNVVGRVTTPGEPPRRSPGCRRARSPRRRRCGADRRRCRTPDGSQIRGPGRAAWCACRSGGGG